MIYVIYGGTDKLHIHILLFYSPGELLLPDMKVEMKNVVFSGSGANLKCYISFDAHSVQIFSAVQLDLLFLQNNATSLLPKPRTIALLAVIPPP